MLAKLIAPALWLFLLWCAYDRGQAFQVYLGLYTCLLIGFWLGRITAPDADQPG